MKISKRVIYYAIGLGLGLILTIVLFAGKDFFGFLPSNRIKEDIKRSNIMITPFEKAQLDCQGIDEAFIFEMIEEADVNFSESQTSYSDESFTLNGYTKTVSVKKYELEYENKKLSFWIAQKDSISILHTMGNACDVAVQDKKSLDILYMPENLIFNELKAKELYLNKSIKCELDCRGISEIELKEVFEAGVILMEESFPARKPNPVYFIKYPIKGVDWVFWVEEGKTKTRIKHVVDATGIKPKKDEFLIGHLFQQITENDPCNCYE